ncbi:MAG TPA: molybdopterin cofactor-binding domain-containing protein [Puia sp.]|nr:molybdopterin cofactor-binding domain-containing protein [Puia sp.]
MHKIARRDFIRHTGLSGLALVLGVAGANAAKRIAKLPAGHLPLNGAGSENATGITPYIIIEPTGKITIINPRTEIGQGTYQSIPALIAEELEVSLDNVTILNSWGQKNIPSQDVGGSDSVKGSYMQLRKVGATAREMLRTAASRQWNVPVEECMAENASIVHKPTGKKLGYGALVATATTLAVPENPPLKDPAAFKILGKSMPRLDIPLKVTGRAVYGIDMEIPGMVYASVEHSPVFGSTLVSYDDSATMKVKGVIRTLKAERVIGKNHYEGVAVIADTYWSALKGRKALNVTWNHQGFDTLNSTTFEQQLRDLAKTEGLPVEDNQGDFDAVMASATHPLEALYETPVLAHAPMEPMNCLAHWQDGDKLDLWTSVQGADIIMDELPGVLDIPRENITPHIQFVGGGFGRRLLADFAGEAARLSKAMGKPVKVVWTREDDIQLGPFRPMTFSAMRGAVSADGKALAMQHKVISPCIEATQDAKYDRSKPSGTMTEGINTQAYEIPNTKNSYVFVDTHIPMQYWRSVTSSTLAFAHECFIDELAVAAGKDPLEFRLGMLTQESDTKRVLTRLRELSGWDKPLPKGWGRGVAQYAFFAGLAANVIEVSTKGQGIKIEKVISVIDLGTVVNPDTVKAQVEGAIVMGIVAATKDGIRFENGRSQQSNFHNYRMLRIDEMPAVEVHILAEGGPTIKGVGEPGLPPVAPALANAIFAATGKRIRRLPFDITKV